MMKEHWEKGAGREGDDGTQWNGRIIEASEDRTILAMRRYWMQVKDTRWDRMLPTLSGLVVNKCIKYDWS